MRDAVLADLMPTEILVPIGAAVVQQGRAIDGVVPPGRPVGVSARQWAAHVERIERTQRIRMLVRALALTTAAGLVVAAVVWEQAALTGVLPRQTPVSDGLAQAPASAAPEVVAPAVPAPAPIVPALIEPPLLTVSTTPRTSGTAEAPLSALSRQASTSAPPPAPSSGKPVEPARATTPTQRSMLVLKSSAATSIERAAEPLVPRKEPVRSADAVTAERRTEPAPAPAKETPARGTAVTQQTYREAAVVTLIDGAAVVIDKGLQRRVGVGETLPGGELLLGVDAAASRIVTDRRVIQLTD